MFANDRLFGKCSQGKYIAWFVKLSFGGDFAARHPGNLARQVQRRVGVEPCWLLALSLSRAK